MTKFLVFRLWGPLCSWGEIAVGESRHTADHPSRSALLGIFAAALGIERGEEQAQAELSAAWSFGVKLVPPGALLRDYHTVQAPPRRGKTRHRTRRSELEAPEPNTLLSSREYRTDSVSVVAATVDPGARWTLETMAAALKEPRFALFLGRKSCPPGLPLAPSIVEKTTLRAALDSRQLPLAGLAKVRKGQQVEPGEWPGEEDHRVFGTRRDKGVRYFWEQDMKLNDAAPDQEQSRYVQFVRYDQPLSRQRWQFARRNEHGWLTSLPREAPSTQEESA